MSTIQIDTSRAKEVPITFFDYDTLPLVVTYRDKSIPASPVPIDLTNYKFEFILKNNATIVANYSIAAGSLTSAFMTKQGSSHETLNFQLMWQDVRKKVKPGQSVRLIQVVTDTTNNPYVHLVYLIDAKQY